MVHDHTHSHTSPGHSHAHGPAPEAEDMEVETDADAPSESAHQATVIACFDTYLLKALSSNQRRRADFYCLSEAHRALLPGYNDLLKQVDAKLQINAQFVEDVIKSNPFAPSDPEAALSAPAPKEGDHERLRSTLRQCVRDWSDLGKIEREETYGPVLRALDSYFGDQDEDQRARLQVLVPGAGLGRLAWEIVRAGFSCQANEFSLYMLIASAFILNHTTAPNEFELYPYLHSFSNTRTRADLLTPIHLPDVLPSSIESSKGDFSFAAGSFEDVYGHERESWDCVVTCFFIDTARNIVQYLERIYALLKPGAPWINIGPTLWHFENTPGAKSIELTLEDVKALAKRIGFVFLEETEVSTSYTSNPLSMLQHHYTAAFWLATKG